MQPTRGDLAAEHHRYSSVRALAELATKITEHAYRITDDDLDRARAHGWTDAQLLEAVWVACQFNATVRLVDTFGLRDLHQLADDKVPVAPVVPVVGVESPR